MQTVAVVAFGTNDESNDDAGGFEIKVRTNTTQLTNTRIARFVQSCYLVRESEVLVIDNTNILSN